MIIKKIRRQAPASADAAEFAYMKHLSRYIVRADIDELQELVRLSDDDYLRDLARYAVAEGREGKALAAGGINLHGDTLPEWEAELAALLHRCPDPAGAIDHWVFSWPQGEKPTVAELEQVLTTFLRCEGLERCKAVWGYHDDTDNPHGHLGVVRIDPVTGARATAGDGWDIDAAHRAKAVIEAQFPQWTPEAGSRYVVRDGALIERMSRRLVGDAANPASWARHRAKSVTTAERPRTDNPAIDAEALAYEEATGFMSRKRIAVEIAVPIVLNAESLDAAHAALAEQGVELRRERSGAIFVIDGKQVKASINRRTSHDAIVDRFKQLLTPSPYRSALLGPRERWPDDPQRRAYYAARRSHDERLTVAAADVRAALGAGARTGPVAIALKAATAAAAFPSFDAWRQGQPAPDPAELIIGAITMSEISVPTRPQVEPVQLALKGYCGTALAGRVVYRSVDQPRGRPAFIDLGTKILVDAGNDPAAVRASLLLISSRYPNDKIAVTGDRAFQKLVLQIANQESIQLDGELGRRQARQVAKLDPEVQPVSSRSERQRVFHDVPSPQGGSAARPWLTKEFTLAMLGRVFHDGGWLAHDFWGSSPDPHQSTHMSRPRLLDDLSPVAAADPTVTKPNPADLARRAAAMALAARSR